MLNFFKTETYKIDPNSKSEAIIEDPNVGEFEILSRKNEYTLVKRLERISNRLGLADGKLQKPVEKDYKNVLRFLGYGKRSKNDKIPCAVFEYGPYTLQDIHQNYRNTQRCIPENIIWNIFRDITRAGGALERDGLWHPGITPNNILFKGGKERFRLSNPFIHDRFLRDYHRARGNINEERVETEINKNTKQLGVTLLGLTSLANNEEMRGGKDLNQDVVSKAMNITKLLYSGELYATISYLLHGKSDDGKLTFQKLRKSVIEASHEIKEKDKAKGNVSFFNKTASNPYNQNSNANYEQSYVINKDPSRIAGKGLPIFESKVRPVKIESLEESRNSDFSRILPPNVDKKSPGRLVHITHDKKMPYLSESDRMFPPSGDNNSRDNSILSQILGDKKTYNQRDDTPLTFHAAPSPEKQQIRGFKNPVPGQPHPYSMRRAAPNTNHPPQNYHQMAQPAQNENPMIFHKRPQEQPRRDPSPQISPIRITSGYNQPPYQGNYQGNNVLSKRPFTDPNTRNTLNNNIDPNFDPYTKLNDLRNQNQGNHRYLGNNVGNVQNVNRGARRAY